MDGLNHNLQLIGKNDTFPVLYDARDILFP